MGMSIFESNSPAVTSIPVSLEDTLVANCYEILDTVIEYQSTLNEFTEYFHLT